MPRLPPVTRRTGLDMGIFLSILVEAIPYEKGGPCEPPFPHIGRSENDQRFENWKLRRALALPNFLRSTTRESRVRKPSFLSGERSSGS